PTRRVCRSGAYLSGSSRATPARFPPCQDSRRLAGRLLLGQARGPRFGCCGALAGNSRLARAPGLPEARKRRGGVLSFEGEASCAPVGQVEAAAGAAVRLVGKNPQKKRSSEVMSLLRLV